MSARELGSCGCVHTCAEGAPVFWSCARCGFEKRNLDGQTAPPSCNGIEHGNPHGWCLMGPHFAERKVKPAEPELTIEQRLRDFGCSLEGEGECTNQPTCVGIYQDGDGPRCFYVGCDEHCGHICEGEQTCWELPAADKAASPAQNAATPRPASPEAVATETEPARELLHLDQGGPV